MVLAVYGPWGSGKTSVKNLVLESLQREQPSDRVAVVEFNPWQWSAQHQVAEAFFEHVWKVLTDFQGFGEWNPFIVRAEGEPRRGERLAVTIRPPGRKGTAFRPIVVAHEPNRELRWLGRVGIPGIFDGEHAHQVEALTGGRTRYVQRERFRGILVPFLGGMLRATEAGFREMSEALKELAEGKS